MKMLCRVSTVSKQNLIEATQVISCFAEVECYLRTTMETETLKNVALSWFKLLHSQELPEFNN